MTTAQGLNLHIYPAPIVSESRIFRQTLAVARAGLYRAIEICGTPAPGLATEEPLSDGRLIRRVGAVAKAGGSVLSRIRYQIAWSAQVYRQYASSDLHTVNAHSVAVLPVAALLARRTGARLIYDTHELETKTSTSHGLQGRVFALVERMLIRRSDVVFVVNDLIREWYETAYPGVRAVSVVNSPSLTSRGAANDLHATFGIPTGSRLFVHVGNIVRARHIPDILAAFAQRPDDHVVFLGDGELGGLVDEAAATHPNIHHHHRIDSDSVVPTLATADVGICLIEPSCLSYALALPNKAIEYTAAGVPFIHNQLPAVRRLLAGGLAELTIDAVDAEFAGVLDGLTDDTIAAAREQLGHVELPSWDEESARMIDEYRRLAASPANRRPRARRGDRP
ncbi:glycosyltransferase [Microbacterium sp. 179-I 3D3 NHS]|uniref:glycosyltransferase n=1 Tax=Microbacterium sp. 179-I 3D3 NHS TaxID=3142382 RepID=UPI0039A3694D